jgi:hypothetical protein
MPAGTLHVSWINKGESSLEHYHVIYQVDGAAGTARARSVRGRQALTTILSSDIALLPSRIDKLFEELESMGTVTLAGLNVAQEDLERLQLA